MTKYYTRTGDDGTTGILGGDRVSKDHPRPEAVGSIDEASAALGLARALSQTSESAEILRPVQRHLYQLMAEVAAAPEHAARFRSIGADEVEWLEARIEAISHQAQSPQEFILPGDTPASAALDVARTIVRRAERRLVALQRAHPLENPHLLRYLNRLSSLCFALEILETQAAKPEGPTLAKGE